MKENSGIPPSNPEDAPTLTLANGPAEALRLIDVMQQKGLSLRLLGGLAVNIRCPSAGHRALNRTYADLDFITLKNQTRIVALALEEQGYKADRPFNAVHGEQRLLFYDQIHQRQIDIFLGVFEMCHKLVLEPRLSLHPLTLNPADLLLTKLQIVQLNAKDIQDMLAILLDFEPQVSTSQPGEELDIRIVVHACVQNWGLYTTVTDNLDRIVQEAQSSLEPEETMEVTRRVRLIQLHMQKEPKPISWKLRDVIGRRVQWYELPEEVNR